MNPTSKKFISLFLAFSLMSISCTTMTTQRQKRFESSKERKHGAKLLITKKDGQLIEGELISVKPNSLLLLDPEGKDVSVGIADIKVIRIVKKSKAGKGALYGLLIGGAAGALLGFASGDDESGFFTFTAEEKALMGGASWGIAGLILGGIAGLTSGKDKTIQIEGMTDSEIKEALDKLRKKARIRDYK